MARFKIVASDLCETGEAIRTEEQGEFATLQDALGFVFWLIELSEEQGWHVESALTHKQVWIMRRMEERGELKIQPV